MQPLSRKTVLKYVLLQLPALALLILVLLWVRRRTGLSLWIFWGVTIAWVAKDAILFPFVWRAYDSGSQTSAKTMVGLMGFAEERLDPVGYVRVRGELWRATAAGEKPIEKGSAVQIRSIKGLTLNVETTPRKDD